MKKLFTWSAALIAALLLAGCGGGSSPGAPANVSVAVHDSSALVSWNMETGVEYWVWSQAGTNITEQSCVSSLACTIKRGATSPYLIAGLTNDASYAVFVNGTSKGSPVGASSPTINFVPRVAGAVWSVGKPLGTVSLLGLGFTPATATRASTFVTAGVGGSIFSSADALTWTARTSNVATNLNAVAYGDGKFIVGGDLGVILTSPDAITWTAVNSGTTNALYAFVVNGSVITAVGANGTILSSGDGTSWMTQVSGVTADLRGITLGNGIYVAVGAKGMLLTSANGANWQLIAPPTLLDLKSVAFGNGTFVAVGASGTLVTSTDGVNWTARPPIAANSLAAVVYGSQFVAVGSGGGIFTSTDGIAWKAAASGTTNDLNAVVFSASLTATLLQVGYAAVGAAGTNLTAY